MLGTGALLFGQQIRQIAYFVPDVAAAAAHHSALYGSGPFFLSGDMTPPCTHRGRPGKCVMSIAIGQWGSLMVEFIQQNSQGASIYHDIYPEGSGRFGFHHVALIVADLPAAVRTITAAGYEIAGRFHPSDGYEVVFVDAIAACGHMIELYAAIPPVLDVYAFVAAASEGFDGTDPLRVLPSI